MVPPPLDASAQFVLSDLLPHEELAAEMEDFRLVSEVTAPRRASATSSVPATSSAPATSREPTRNADSTVIKKSETSGSMTKVPSPQRASANRHHYGVTADSTVDSESEDSDTTPRPFKSAARPSSGGNSKPSGSSGGNSKPSGSSGGNSKPSGSSGGNSKTSGSSGGNFKTSGSSSGNSTAPDEPHHSTTKEKLKTAGILLGVGAVTGAVAVVGAPFVLAGLGFTSSGVAAGSLAASYQATLGGVILKGSLFSLCQSAGAAGLSATGSATVAAAAGSVGAAMTHVVSKIKQAKNPGNGTGDGTDTGSEAGTQERAKAEGASGTRKKGNGRYTCRECDCGCGTSKAKSANREPTEEIEGQNTCRQNVENEKAAEKQRAFRKQHF